MFLLLGAIKKYCPPYSCIVLYNNITTLFYNIYCDPFYMVRNIRYITLFKYF